MPNFRARIQIRLKKGILDPQGQAISHALQSLGFNEINNVRTGKLIELSIKAPTPKKASEQVEQACKKLLANPVIEEYEFELTEQDESVTA